MNELVIDNGQFMGHTLRRTQVLLGNRKFVAIPVRFDTAQGTRGGRQAGIAGAAGQGLGSSSLAKSAAAVQGAALHQQMRTWWPTPKEVQAQVDAMNQIPAPGVVPPSNQPLLDAMRYGTSMLEVKTGPQVVVSSTPRRGGKSILDTFKRFIHPGKVHEIKSLENFNAEMHGTFDTAETLPVKVPDPECSAYGHTNTQRAVPLIRLDAQPNFFLNDTVGRAMVNAIDSVCDTKRGEELGSDVRRLRAAVYRPLGMYKPDVDGAWTGDKDTSSLFFRQTIHLNEEWDLDIRHATGVYQAEGRSWLGVFIHGIAARTADKAGRVLSPRADDEEKYWLKHRGQCAPTGLFFDLFMPCEPEVITEEWGWGADLEELTKAREANAVRDARANSIQGYDAFPTNKWDAKAKSHKSAKQINKTQMAIDHEARMLGERYMDALKERERARQVLYSYAWKALMLGVMECRQLTVEKY